MNEEHLISSGFLKTAVFPLSVGVAILGPDFHSKHGPALVAILNLEQLTEFSADGFRDVVEDVSINHFRFRVHDWMENAVLSVEGICGEVAGLDPILAWDDLLNL